MEHTVFLVGPHRSGTTWLGAAFSSSPEVAYWEEPRQVWEYGNWFRADDTLDRQDARPSVVRHIRSRFNRYATRRGARIFCEKTPCNCLRIPFIDAVFPESFFVLIVRDGRSVFRSVREELKTGSHWRRIYQRLRETRISEYPAFLNRIQWLAAKISRRPLQFWGPRPPGWRKWLEDDPPYLVLARQWAATAEAAWEGIAQLDSDRRLVLRYEELVAAPREVLGACASQLPFCDLAPVVEHLARSARPSRRDAWRNELDEESLRAIRPVVEPTLQKLGYEW